MANKKNTRRALFTSIMSLILCCAMLMGTTFAWFTDSVTSGNNIIKSGNLDVELYYQTEGQSDWTMVDANTNVFKNDTLWEPGHTEVVKLKVVNAGSLALKYQLGVNVSSETGSVNVGGTEFKLSDYIKFGIMNGSHSYTRDQAVTAVDATATALNVAYTSATTSLAAGAEQIVTMVVYMPTSVGNEANHAKGAAQPTINLGVILNATQQTNESDSFGSDYDGEAWHPDMIVYNATDLQAAVNEGGKIELGANVEMPELLVIPEEAEVSLNLNGHDLSTADPTTDYLFNNLGTLTLMDTAADATTYGSRSISARGIYNGYSADGNHVTSAKLTILSGEYNAMGTNGGAAVYNYGTVDILGGTFTSNGGYALNNQPTGNMTVSNADVTGGIYNQGTLTINNSEVYQHISGRHAIYNWCGSVVVNGGAFDSESGNELIMADGDNASVVINGGTFDKTAKSWLFGAATGKNITFVINGGTFNGYVNLPENTVDTIRPYNDPIVVNGGTFNFNPTPWITGNYVAIDNNGTWNIIALSGETKLPSGTVLNLNGTEVTGTIIAEGNLTIMGDTKIKTLKATNGGIITIEDGKTLTLNNFSFGSADNNTAEYTITGGTVKANYGFFQHGKYNLYSNFETGYMYYSYGSDITVYGTFHSRGEGDGLDYVRGKVTIAKVGRSIHDKSLWVGQPESWGAMNATLVVEEGGYLQANSLSVYSGSTMQIDAKNATAGEVSNIVCSSITKEGTIEAINNDNLTAVVNGNKITLN